MTSKFLTVASGFALALFAPSAASATTITVGGVVTCSSGAVTGVWVQSSKGGSKFADWKPMKKISSRHASYSASIDTVLPTRIQLRVGCGGKQQKWKTTNVTPYRAAGGSKTWNAFCDAKGKCKWPSTGTKSVAANGKPWNWGAPKYCTWGALDRWKRHAGYYPKWGGNAALWPTNAPAYGWTATAVPMPKAMVVTRTTGAGHVGWVNSVAVSKAGEVSLSVTEMNYDGTDKVATGRVRTKSYVASPTFSYIPVP